MSFDSSVAGYAYWYYLYTAIGISSYSILSIFLVLSRLNKLLEKLLNHARSLALLLLPIIGNIIFVPMVLVLLSIFQCDQGIGQEITDSFIRHDCTNYCWDNKYVLPGVLSIISLGSYIPSAIYFRIYYENCNVYINIKMKPIFLIEKSICQVVMISMNKTVKFYDESLHGLCCIIIFAIFIALCFKQNPYNYYKWIFGWLFHISQFRGALLYHLSIGSQILIIYLYDIYFNIQYSLF
ncbi:unnamed protein product [Blepharisma stoltei]|uniref:Uncharacterized protein n=1 Tax=Blepharisma stoltei TaxID=1481888 RepID=A0AAU9I8F8_9CILI|nr:unnamed protein product [Blepharisma stoltei]